MPTNIGFDNGHPYLEVGADEGEIALVGGRYRVSSIDNRAVSYTLDRSVDGGVTWESVLAEAISGQGANLTDYECLSYGDTIYRAVAFTAEGATSETTVTVSARSGALWLGGGPAYALTCRLPLNPEVAWDVARERTLKEYAGRSRPVAVVGERTSRSVQVSGRVTDRLLSEETATPDELAEVALSDSRLFLFRDPDGRRVYGTIGNVSLPREMTLADTNGWNAAWGYRFTLTEAT